MAQAFYCPTCRVAYTAALRGRSCPACGEELVHGRVPAGKSVIFGNYPKKSGHASRAVWDHITKRDPCVYCGDPSTTIDHILPKALGGSKGSWTNRAGCCFRCNQDKAHTPLLHFMLEQVGEDLSHVKDDDGRWPLPDLAVDIENNRKYTLLEEAQAREAHVDPRRLLLNKDALVPA